MYEDLKEIVSEYNNCEEAKEVLESIKKEILGSRSAISSITTLVNNFVDSEEFKNFWKGREKAKHSEMVEMISNSSCGNKLVESLKNLSAAHLKLNLYLLDYSQKAFNKILESMGILLFSDCMSEVQTEGKEDFFPVFLARLEEACRKLGEFALDTCRKDLAQSSIENLTIH